jgi:hypothetical protein
MVVRHNLPRHQTLFDKMEDDPNVLFKMGCGCILAWISLWLCLLGAVGFVVYKVLIHFGIL